MKYCSIDLETTGLNTERDQILSVGMIVEDTKLKLPYKEIPKFHCYIKHERIEGGVTSINMNNLILQRLSDYWKMRMDERVRFSNELNIKFYDESTVWNEMYDFIVEHIFEGERGFHHVNIAGKNFNTFDKLFIERLPLFGTKGKRLKFRQSVLDPGILYVNWEDDEFIPSLSTCKERMGDMEEVSHDALDDAWDVIKLLRKHY